MGKPRSASAHRDDARFRARPASIDDDAPTAGCLISSSAAVVFACIRVERARARCVERDGMTSRENSPHLAAGRRIDDDALDDDDDEERPRWMDAKPMIARPRTAETSVSMSEMHSKNFRDERVKDSRDEARARGVYVPPNVEEAKERADAVQPRIMDENGNLKQFSLFDKDVDLGLEFGAGVSGYFIVTVSFAWLFFIAFAMNMPVMYLHYTSTFYASQYEAEPMEVDPPEILPGRPRLSYHSWYVNWHWANPMSASLGTVAPDTVPQREWVVAGAGSGVMRWSTSKVDYIRFAALMDVLSTTMLLLSVPVLLYALRRNQERVERGTATIKDYSVLVTGLPTDVTEEEIRCFFALKYGTVVGVTLVGAECFHVRLQRRRLRLMEDYDEAEAALIAAGNRGGDVTKVRIEKEIVKVERKVAQRRSRTRAKRSSAFVTFDDERSKTACLLYNKRSLLSYAFAFPRNQRFRGKLRFRVKAASEPEDVRYENLHLPNRAWRRVLVFIGAACVACLCYGFLKLLVADKEDRWRQADMFPDILAEDIGIVIALGEADDIQATHAAQFRTACKPKLEQCGTAFSRQDTYVGLTWGSPGYVFYDYPNATLQDRHYAQEDLVRDLRRCADHPERCPGVDTQDCYACFCASLKYGLPKQVVRLYNKPIRAACEPYLRNGPGEYYNWLWNALLITLMNLILSLVAPALVAIERLQTYSATNALKTKIIFAVRYFNVAITYTLLNANFHHVGKYFPLLKQMFGLKGEYSDFTPEWYNDVGLVLFMAIMLNAMMRCMTRVFVDVGYFLRKKIACSTKHTQKKLNEAFEGPVFDIGGKVGDVCFTTMAAMTFASGMPILYLVLSMYFVLISAYDYRLLFKVCQTPERLRARLPKSAVKVLFASLAMHAFLGMWMYSYHWTPDLLEPSKPFADSIINKHDPLAYAIGGASLNPAHDNDAMMAVVAADGVATRYMNTYVNSTMGSVTETSEVAGAPRRQLRFTERPFSEAGMPFMGLCFAVIGAAGLWAIAYRIANLGKSSRKQILSSHKKLPLFQDAVLTGLLVGSDTYDPQEQRAYAFLMDKKLSKKRALTAQLRGDAPDRGDSVNSRDAFGTTEPMTHANDVALVKKDSRYNVNRDYDGGAPWVRQTRLYGGEDLRRGRGSRGTHQRDGGHGHAYVVADVRALGGANDYTHRENDAYDAYDDDDDRESADFSGSDLDTDGTLADDASTQPSERYESEYDDMDDNAGDGAYSRRPAWLN